RRASPDPARVPPARWPGPRPRSPRGVSIRSPRAIPASWAPHRRSSSARRRRRAAAGARPGRGPAPSTRGGSAAAAASPGWSQRLTSLYVVDETNITRLVCGRGGHMLLTTRREFVSVLGAGALGVRSGSGEPPAQPGALAAFAQEFPALRQRVNGQPLLYLDSAATTLRPQRVTHAR